MLRHRENIDVDISLEICKVCKSKCNLRHEIKGNKTASYWRCTASLIMDDAVLVLIEFIIARYTRTFYFSLYTHA